jgi:hypothetical protein
MASIDLTSGTAGAYGAGELQLQGKVQMTSTLTPVTDNLNVASPLLLSTTLVQTTSTLKITTNDNPYIDAEDGSGNNRFTVGRDTASQQVNVDFASNPVGSTTAVGAIRTYRDGTNLSEAMTFIEDGSVGIGTTTPNIYATGGATNIVSIQATGTDAGAILDIAGTGTGFSGVNMGNESIRRAFLGTIDGGNFGIYTNTTNTGTVVTERLTITAAGLVGIGTSSPSNFLQVTDPNSAIGGAQLTLEGRATGYGAGVVFSSRVDNASGALVPMAKITGDGEDAWSSTASTQDAGMRFSTSTNGSLTEKMRITSAGNVGIGTSTPASKLQVEAASGSPTIILSRLASAVSYELGNFSNAGSDLYFNGTANIFINADSNSDSSSADRNVIIGNRGVEYARFTTSGLTFNGDTAAANALDDYEEGTWTMGVAFGGGSTGVTYVYNTGTYTKIGRQVTINGLVQLSNKGSDTGAAIITGLPFVIPNSTQNYTAASLWLFNIDFANQFQGVGIINSTNISLFESTEGGVVSSLNDTDFANNSEVILSLTYFV